MSQRLSPVLVILHLALLLFAGTAVMSMLSAYDRSLSLPTVIAIVISIMVYAVLVFAIRTDQGAYLLTMGAAAFGTLFALFFITQFGHQGYTEVPAFLARFARFTTLLPDLGVHLHQNSVATLLEMILPLALVLLFFSKGRMRLVWGACVVILLYAVLLTYSRSGWIGIALALLIGLVVVGMTRLSPLRAALVVVAIVGFSLLLLILVVTLGAEMPFFRSAVETLNSRLEIFRNGFYLAGDYPITGIGPGGTFAMIYARYSLMIFVPLVTYAFNLPLAILVGQGVIGLLAFVLIVLMFYLYIYRVLRESQPDAPFYGAWIGVTATLIHGIGDARQYVESPFVMPVLFFGMALAVICGRIAIHNEVLNGWIESGGRGRLLAGIGVIAVIVLAGGFVLFNQPIRAAYFTNRGALDETRADTFIRPNVSEDERAQLVASARGWYERALAALPDYANASRRLGNMSVDEAQFEPAIPLLETALAAEPTYQAARKGLGLAYVWVGRTADAACMFRQLDSVSEMREELYNWAQFRAENGQFLLSAYALDSAAVLDDYEQSNMDVWRLIGERYEAGGDTEQAVMWYSRILLRQPDDLLAQERLQALGRAPVEVSLNALDCPT